MDSLNQTPVCEHCQRPDKPVQKGTGMCRSCGDRFYRERGASGGILTEQEFHEHFLFGQRRRPLPQNTLPVPAEVLPIKTPPTVQYHEPMHGLVYASPAMVQLMTLVHKVAVRSGTVIITGETGVGKELIAQLLHELSPNSQGPFLVVDCPALSPNLAASALFGHVKGAFTDAIAARRGILAGANGGTIFFDEIMALSPEVQAQLLRPFEKRTFQSVGSETYQRFDSRIVVATNEPLAGLVDRGMFRQDLLQRLNVFPIHIPPLRERRDDILVIARHYLERNREPGSPAVDIEPEAMDMLMGFNWPGNVRQLLHVLEWALMMREDQTGPISLRALPQEVFKTPTRLIATLAGLPR